MRVIPPFLIKDTNLVSSDIAEPTVGTDPSAWVSNSGYALGVRVYLASTHKIYECVSAITGATPAALVSPATDVGLAIPKWIEVGYTNRWAMFDQLRNTASICSATPTTIAFTIPSNMENPEYDPYYDKVTLLQKNSLSTSPIDYSKYSRKPSFVSGSGIATDASTMGTPSISYTGGYMLYADSSDWTMNGDWTIESELRLNATGATLGVQLIFFGQGDNTGYASWAVGKDANNKLMAYFRNTSGALSFTSDTGASLVAGVNYHIVYERKGNVITLYCNGEPRIVHNVTDGMLSSSGSLAVGGYGDYSHGYGTGGGTVMAGYIKTFRITSGVARYADAYRRSLVLLGIDNVGQIAVDCSYNNGTSDVSVYSNTFDMTTRSVIDWYTYFFAPFTQKKALIVPTLPITYTTMKITLVITGAVGMEIGACIVGNSTYIGKLQTGAESDILNFSSMDRDQFGNATLVKRRSVPKLTGQLFVDKKIFADVLAIKQQLDAAPAVWYGIDDPTDPYYEILIILGMYRDFTFQLDNPIGPRASIDLEEI